MLRTVGTPRQPPRRRRRPRESDPVTELEALPLTRATSIRAFEPFVDPAAAERWLDAAAADEDAADRLIAAGIELLNRALHAQAVAGADPLGAELSPERAVAVRLGWGSGEETADGRFSSAREIDVRSAGASRRQRRQDDLRPQERVAAVLGGRERLDACETLLLRARADLDAAREREAALQLRVGLEALLAELRGAVADPGHDEDMGALTARRAEIGDLANEALRGDLDAERVARLRQLLELGERILRRRRLLRG